MHRKPRTYLTYPYTLDVLLRAYAGLKKNPCLRQSGKDGDWITLTPLDAQPDPPKLAALKAELNAQWPMSSLLDIVKKTDLRLASPKRSKPDMR